MLLLILPLLAACNNDCSFFEQCDGDVLQVCGDGVDQMIGREVHETPCDGLNTVCVEIDEHNAMCAAAPATTCDMGSFQPTCNGDVLITCSGVQYGTPVDYDTAYQVQVDCAADGRTCDEAAGSCQ